ncbi:MAG TPA: muconate cycloisomerase [Armatimonadetes bacterium]|nr:muconate cycloisomerase [Armatimonadota bacterium]
METDRIVFSEAIACALPTRQREDESRGRAQQHVFLRLETEGGAVGWGEARALPSWTGETLAAITNALTDYWGPILVGSNPFARNAIMATGDEMITPSLSNGMPTARSAVDMALHDLQGQITGLSVHELLGGRVRGEISLSPSLRAESPERLREDCQRWTQHRCVKMKLVGDLGLDAERLAAVSEAVPQASIWLDGNQNYTPTSAATMLERIRSIRRCVLLQQPTPANDWFGLAQLKTRSWLPLAVDEGCYSAADAMRLARAGACDLITLKTCKAGGLRDLVRQAEVARAAGLDLLGSGLTESGIGLAAALHVYSTLQLRLPPQLNGPQYLEDLLVAGLQLNHRGDGYVVPDGAGLGIEVDEERLRSYALAH